MNTQATIVKLPFLPGLHLGLISNATKEEPVIIVHGGERFHVTKDMIIDDEGIERRGYRVDDSRLLRSLERIRSYIARELARRKKLDYEYNPISEEKEANRVRLFDLVLKLKALELLGEEASVTDIVELQNLYNQVY